MFNNFAKTRIQRKLIRVHLFNTHWLIKIFLLSQRPFDSYSQNKRATCSYIFLLLDSAYLFFLMSNLLFYRDNTLWLLLKTLNFELATTVVWTVSLQNCCCNFCVFNQAIFHCVIGSWNHFCWKRSSSPALTLTIILVASFWENNYGQIALTGNGSKRKG